MPLGTRIVAAADTWAERSGDDPPDLTGDKGLDPACLAALRSWAKPGTSCRRQHLHAAPALSSRELEVLRLLAEGATNPDISKAPYTSRRTVEHHVEHILAKLAVTSCTAAVAYDTVRDAAAANLAQTLDFTGPPNLVAPQWAVPAFTGLPCPPGSLADYESWNPLAALAQAAGWPTGT